MHIVNNLAVVSLNLRVLRDIRAWASRILLQEIGLWSHCIIVTGPGLVLCFLSEPNIMKYACAVTSQRRVYKSRNHLLSWNFGHGTLDAQLWILGLANLRAWYRVLTCISVTNHWRIQGALPVRPQAPRFFHF